MLGNNDTYIINKLIKIVIIEDNAFVRKGWELVLSEEKDIIVLDSLGLVRAHLNQIS